MLRMMGGTIGVAATGAIFIEARRLPSRSSRPLAPAATVTLVTDHFILEKVASM
jgi:hypothetical protein